MIETGASDNKSGHPVANDGHLHFSAVCPAVHRLLTVLVQVNKINFEIELSLTNWLNV